MARKTIRRLGELVLVLLIVGAGTFALMDLMPGDPAVVVLAEDGLPLPLGNYFPTVCA